MKKKRSLFILGMYLFSVLVGLLALAVISITHDFPLKSRAPSVLILASFLLAINQLYGLNWATNKTQPPNSEILPLANHWRQHIARVLSPLVIALSVLVHFFFLQSDKLTNGHIAPQGTVESFIYSSFYLVGFLIYWLAVTYTFHFQTEIKLLHGIQTQLNELGKLNFDFRSDPQNAWGLWSFLQDQLNKFSKTLSERNRLLNNFSRFVTREVAHRATKTDLSETIGINRDLTVLMSDIRNFTSISEKLPASTVVEMLNRYFSAMLDELSKHSVVVDKFIGDGILAYVESGKMSNQTPEDRDNSIAVYSALAMLKKMDELNIGDSNLPKLQIGIGIYRGPVVMGLIGGNSKLQHTIIGDTVNRTARLEGLCKELDTPLVISEGIWKTLDFELKDLFTPQGAKIIKGIAEPIEIYGLSNKSLSAVNGGSANFPQTA